MSILSWLNIGNVALYHNGVFVRCWWIAGRWQGAIARSGLRWGRRLSWSGRRQPRNLSRSHRRGLCDDVLRRQDLYIPNSHRQAGMTLIIIPFSSFISLLLSSVIIRRFLQLVDSAASIIPLISRRRVVSSLIYIHASLDRKITFPFALIIKYPVNRSALTIKLEEHCVFKFFAVIIALE